MPQNFHVLLFSNDFPQLCHAGPQTLSVGSVSSSSFPCTHNWELFRGHSLHFHASLPRAGAWCGRSIAHHQHIYHNIRFAVIWLLFSRSYTDLSSPLLFFHSCCCTVVRFVSFSTFLEVPHPTFRLLLLPPTLSVVCVLHFAAFAGCICHFCCRLRIYCFSLFRSCCPYKREFVDASANVFISSVMNSICEKMEIRLNCN